MRICLVSREYPPDTGWGGIGTFTYHHAHALTKAGHDVQVIALSADERSHVVCAEGEPSVHRVAPTSVASKSGLFNFCLPVTRPMLDETSALFDKLVEVHRRKPFDVVECPEHFAEGIFAALSGLAPLVLRLHTPHSKLVKERYHNFEPTFDHRVLTILERVAMLSADALVSPSEDLAAYVAADLNIPRERITIIRNPVDTQKFSPEGPKTEIFVGETVNILFVGRLEERKGIFYLIEAIPEVIRKCPQARFIIVGSDTKTGAGNTSVLAELKARLQKNGGEAAVSFQQHINLDRVPEFYRSADIFVLPSLYDNAPMTVIEAMATGVPVVASSAGGAKEYAPHGQCGLIVPPADPSALSEALVTLVDNRSLRKDMAGRARRRALESFSTEQTARQSIELYERAQEIFKHRPKSSLYAHQPQSLTGDLREFIASFEKRLYDMMFTHSLRFRFNHWRSKIARCSRMQ